MGRPFRIRRRPLPHWHIVGDSTATPLEQRNSFDGTYSTGVGSTESGRGYTAEAPNGTITLTPPEAPTVICQASVWDYESVDLSGYTDAHNYYLGYGITPIWVELPPSSAVGGAPEVTEAGAATFNTALAAELGVTLIGYAIRQVATSDGLHPTVQGAEDLVDRYTDLVGDQVSRLRGDDSATLRGSQTWEQRIGTGTAALGGSFTATGTRTVEGTGAASLGGSFTATGTRIAEGTGAATLGGTFTATGTRIAEGTGTAGLGGTFTATGTRQVLGTATAPLGGAFTGTGTRTVEGTGTAPLGGTFTATGTVISGPASTGTVYATTGPSSHTYAATGTEAFTATTPTNTVHATTGPSSRIYATTRTQLVVAGTLEV